MPCSPAKARLLLKEKKAVVKRRSPFTIGLTQATGEAVQPVTLGVDAGSETIGLSASTDKAELYASEVGLRTDVVDLLGTRRELRRARRSRKTRHRAPRSDNRVHSKNKGWLAPSVENKVHAHLSRVEAVRKILPISKIRVETASFDIQKIKNPDIEGAQYQQGDQLGFWNVREYVLCRDGHQCCHCHSKSKDPILNVHHLESRRTGGDAPNNLITLCETCHKAYHAGKTQGFYAAVMERLHGVARSDLNDVLCRYLDYAARQAERQVPMLMKDWVSRLSVCLQWSDDELSEARPMVMATIDAVLQDVAADDETAAVCDMGSLEELCR